MRINLEATNDNERAIAEYLEANASDALAEKINTGKKDYAQCWQYIMKKAREHLKGHSGYIDPKIVFGWAVHFFEEDKIEEEMKDMKVEYKPVKKETVPAAVVKKAEPPKPKKEAFEETMNLMDWLGGAK